MTLVSTIPAYRSDLASQIAVRGVSASSCVKILIVDDQPANLMALEVVLETLGHTIVRARSGEEALKCVLQDDFAVILMDVYMPGMDGFETAEIIRQRVRSSCIPIIFLTAMGMSELHVSRGYSAGGIDYLFKPFVPEILKAKVAAFIDLYLKNAMIARQAEQLREFERQRHQAELHEAQLRLEAEKVQQDALAAQQVQQLLFPHVNPSCSRFEIGGASYPAAAIGGDYFDYFSVAEGYLDIVVGDVSGHGMPAALLMSATRAYVRAIALARPAIDEVLALANQALTSDLEGTRFVTLFYARLDLNQLSLNYSSAGHPDCYILNKEGDVKWTLESTSFPMGIIANAEFPRSSDISLVPGDLIFLFTDGLAEAKAPEADGKFFGMDRALNVVRNHRAQPADRIIESLRSAVGDFMNQALPPDDITVIVVKVK